MKQGFCFGALRSELGRPESGLKHLEESTLASLGPQDSVRYALRRPAALRRSPGARARLYPVPQMQLKSEVGKVCPGMNSIGPELMKILSVPFQRNSKIQECTKVIFQASRSVHEIGLGPRGSTTSRALTRDAIGRRLSGSRPLRRASSGRRPPRRASRTAGTSRPTATTTFRRSMVDHQISSRSSEKRKGCCGRIASEV